MTKADENSSYRSEFHPRDPEITDLAVRLAHKGISDREIEDLIKHTLRDRLALIEQVTPASLEEGYSRKDPSVLEGLAPRLPWRLQFTGEGSQVVTSHAERSIEQIFELFPSVQFLTLHTSRGDASATRNFPSGYTQRVDELLASIFQKNPDITGVTFPARQGQPMHTATPENPFWAASEKARAEKVRGYLAAVRANKADTPRISQEEMARRQKIVEQAYHDTLMTGIVRDRITDPIYEAFVRGEIEIDDLIPAIKSLWIEEG